MLSSIPNSMTALVRAVRSARRRPSAPGCPSTTMRSHPAQGSGASCPGLTTRFRPRASGPAKRCQSGSSTTGWHPSGGFGRSTEKVGGLGRSADSSVSLGGADPGSVSMGSPSSGGASSEQVRTSSTVPCRPPQCPQAIIAALQASVARYADFRSLPSHLPGIQRP